MTDATITKTIFLSAPRATVWAFLTEQDKLATWFHSSDGDLSEGPHVREWDGKDGLGSGVASGPYFVRLKHAQGRASWKVMLVR